jgi:hypothetical protein
MMISPSTCRHILREQQKYRPMAAFFSTIHPLTSVHKRGDSKYGTREYLLLPKFVTLEDSKKDPTIIISSLYAHKNIIFGAKLKNSTNHDFISACTPLLQAALQDAGSMGEQPQALASLSGLCQFIQTCFEQEDPILQQLDPIAYDACKAIATGIPRPGHSVVGVGTFHDGKVGWELLAKEFVKRNLAEEVTLYESKGGQVVCFEHLADKSESYMKTAGGTMCRLFFV